MKIVLMTFLFLGFLIPTKAINNEEKKQWKFDFGNGEVEQGYKMVSTETLYSQENGFGLIGIGTLVSLSEDSNGTSNGDCITSKEPFYFNVNLPEGRYKVTVKLGNPQSESLCMVKAESRRLMVKEVSTQKGEIKERTFIVDVRTPIINHEKQIALKKRELNYKNWDNNLSLEFNGTNPTVVSVIIEEANDLPVIFLAGDSTVTDQEYEPWASWGQMFPCFLKPEVVVANFAESGETLIGFRKERRLQKILSVMKEGDYLIIEFAHNDQKKGSCHVDPYTTYQDELRLYISEAKKLGGKPILVTSTNRRKFDEKGKLINTLDEYPNAMRQLAKEENLPLIDLNAHSKNLYEAWGIEESKKAFVHYAENSFPGQTRVLADNTHFNAYGAYMLAKCVVKEILKDKLEIANYVIDDFGKFNSKKPEAFNTFYWPFSPKIDIVKPDGN